MTAAVLLRRLGVASRTEAATLAGRCGPLGRDHRRDVHHIMVIGSWGSSPAWNRQPVSGPSSMPGCSVSSTRGSVMRDPDADMSRRVWVACSRCSSARGCRTCRDARTCPQHWSYLLAAEGRRLFVQCPHCWHRWWHDTRFGVGDGPADLDRQPHNAPPTRHAT